MDWMIYGANGYTGELIAREAKKRGAVPVIAGRDAAKIAELATDLSLPSKVFSLDAPIDVAAALAGVGLVLNCAGLEFGDQEWTSRARGGSQLLLAACGHGVAKILCPPPPRMVSIGPAGYNAAAA